MKEVGFTEVEMKTSWLSNIGTAVLENKPVPLMS
jgi:hypothetical protein